MIGCLLRAVFSIVLGPECGNPVKAAESVHLAIEAGLSND